ncbi:MAG: transposase [Patescibacteria group bacterium]
MSDKFRNIYRIPSSRLSNWNYSENGYYFVTICTKEREHYFGEIINNKMNLSKIGKIVQKYWFEIPYHFPFVELDEFIVMPNHIHGITIIKNQHNFVCRDVINHVSTENTNKNIFSKISPMNKHSLGAIIRWYKGRTTFEIRKQKFNFSWQTRFYDQIIRNEKSLYYIRQYIRDNPINWETDRNNLTSEF